MNSIKLPKSKYFTAEHRGGLKESMQTERRITKDAFNKLIKSKLYEFYAYDERIKSKVYIINEMANNIGLPTWIHECKKARIEGFYTYYEKK